MNNTRNQMIRERVEAATHALQQGLAARCLDVQPSHRGVLVTRGEDRVYLDPESARSNYRPTGKITLTFKSEGQSRTFTYNPESGWNIDTIIKRLEAEFRYQVGRRHQREIDARLREDRDTRRQALIDAGLMSDFDPNVVVYASGAGKVTVSLPADQLEDFLREMKERGLR